MMGDTEQALAVDGAMACFSSRCLKLWLNVVRAPQLERGVMRLTYSFTDEI
jgi:hypothetical protein